MPTRPKAPRAGVATLSIPTLHQAQVHVHVHGAAAPFRSRVLGQRGRKLLLSVPIGRAPRGSWAKPPAHASVQLADGISFRVQVNRRALKPVPLLVVEALEDIPLAPFARPARQTQRARWVAVASGKGGTGKTTFCANLAWHAAQQGLNTALLDADIGAANAALHFNVRAQAHLGSVLTGERPLQAVGQAITSTLTLFPGLHGDDGPVDLNPWHFGRLLGAIDEELDGRDLMIVDVGAGVHAEALNFLINADAIVIVTQDDPASASGVRSLVRRIAKQTSWPSLHLLVNRAAAMERAEKTARELLQEWKEMPAAPPNFLGIVPDDALVGQSLEQGRPLLAAYPGCDASAAYRQACRRLLSAVLD